MNKLYKALVGCALSGLALLSAGCRKDPSLKASVSECEQACAHAKSFNAKIGLSECANSCIRRDWTFGDTSCVQAASGWDEVKNCGAMAKALLAEQDHGDVGAELQAAAERQKQADEEKAKLGTQAEEQRKRVDALLAQLAVAKDDATRIKLQRQLEEEKAKQDGARSRPAGSGKPCNCTPGDPLCTCL